MIASLRKANELIEQQQLQIEELSKKLSSSQRQVDTLQHQVEQLLRRIYGRRSEKFDPNQLSFDNILIQAIEQSAASQDHVEDLPESSTPAKKSSRQSKRRHRGRLRGYYRHHSEYQKTQGEIPRRRAADNDPQGRRQGQNHIRSV